MRSLHFDGILVLVDRVDEPYLVNGSVELMRALVWPILDNKFLKHQGLGLKLLLPSELERLVDRESRDFQQRARLDKQNLIRSLSWTGQSLYDLAGARIAACAAEGRSPKMLDLFEDIEPRRLIEAFGVLRVPRHLFKFFYRLLTAHCNSYTEEQPVWKISPRHVRIGARALPQRRGRVRPRARGGVSRKKGDWLRGTRRVCRREKRLRHGACPPFFARRRVDPP